MNDTKKLAGVAVAGVLVTAVICGGLYFNQVAATGEPVTIENEDTPFGTPDTGGATATSSIRGTGTPDTLTLE